MSRIKLIEADNRLSIKYNKTEGIYNWGDDNCYPSLIKSLVGASVTAKQCSDLNSKYIAGKGFLFAQDSSVIINSKGMTINQLLRVVSKEFSEQNNIFLHVNYNALYQVISAVLLPSTDVRIGEADSTNYSGKFVVYGNWDKSKGKSIKKDDFQLIDRFNPNEAVIDAQVEKAGGWNRYKGQILHINGDFSDTYSLSDGNSVLKAMDSENQTDDIGNAVLRKGLFGSKVVVVPSFDDDPQRNQFERTLRDLKGAENSSGILLLEAPEATDDLTKQINVQSIDTNIDNTFIDGREQSAAKRIRKAFGVPAILIEDTDNSIFGNSGELIKQARKQHWEDKWEERAIIQEAFKRIFSLWKDNINPSNDWTITPITLETNEQPNNDSGAKTV